MNRWDAGMHQVMDDVVVSSQLSAASKVRALAAVIGALFLLRLVCT